MLARPIEPGRIGLYACGPTVYDYAHLGHARCYVVWDAVVRHLRRRAFAVKYVRNFTDVDDKIIKRAGERGEDPGQLAERFAKAFLEDMDAVGCLRPDLEPRVTGHIPEIVTLIETLVRRGFAYAPGNGDVYFSAAQVIYAAAYRLAGLEGVVILCAGLIAWTFALLYRQMD